MKYRFYTALAVFAVTSGFALMAQPSFAQTAGGAAAAGGAPASTGTGGGHHKNGNGGAGHGAGHEACERILEACRQHGFIKGQWKKDNGLYKDCFDPIVNGGGVTQDGKTVSVSVSQSDVQVCREHKAHEKEHKEHKQGQQGSGTGSGVIPNAKR